MAVNPHLEDGQSFVEGRSEERARELIEAADAAGIDRSEIYTTSDGYIVPDELAGDYDAKKASDFPAVPTEPGTTTDPKEATNVGGTEQDPDEQVRRANEAAERQASFEPDEPTDKEAVGDYDENTEPNHDTETPTVSEGGVRVTDEDAQESPADGTVRTANDARREADETPTPVDEADEEEGEEQFDPSKHTVDEVWEHLESANDAERQRVLAAEREGKDRKAFHSETEGDK